MAITSNSSPAIENRTDSQSLLHTGPGGPAIDVELSSILKQPQRAQGPHEDVQIEGGRMLHHITSDLMMPLLEVDDQRGKGLSLKHRATLAMDERHENGNVLEATGVEHIVGSHLDPDEQAMLPKLQAVPGSPRRGKDIGCFIAVRGENDDGSSIAVSRLDDRLIPISTSSMWSDSTLSLSSEIARGNKRRLSRGQGEGDAPKKSRDASGDPTIDGRDRATYEPCHSTFDQSVMRHVKKTLPTQRLVN